MAIEIKVIPTLTGEDARRFVENAEMVTNSHEQVDFTQHIAEARAILQKAHM